MASFDHRALSVRCADTLKGQCLGIPKPEPEGIARRKWCFLRQYSAKDATRGGGLDSETPTILFQ